MKNSKKFNMARLKDNRRVVNDVGETNVFIFLEISECSRPLDL